MKRPFDTVEYKVGDRTFKTKAAALQHARKTGAKRVKKVTFEGSFSSTRKSKGFFG